jgi:hypothetical protein
MSVSTKTTKRAAKKYTGIKAKKPKALPSAEQGLCSTCNKAAHCGYKARNKRAVLFCEEFDSTVPTITEETTVESFPTLEEMREWDEYKGLCVNCENRKDCAIRNKEIGVWHCEEYQ